MAKSKNKRRNGQVAKNNPAKRMRALHSFGLKDLMVCNVVDRVEVGGDRGDMVLRTLVYNGKHNKIVPITKTQELAFKNTRWFWNIQMGIVCRRQDGEVYLDKETNTQLKTEVLLVEMNDYVVDQLMALWEKVNPLHALTMYWVACPYDIDERGMEGVPQEAVLAPLWKYNVLGNMLTQYEQDTPDLPVVHYRTDNFVEFCKWFTSQQRHRNELKEPRTITYWFEPSGKRMQKGELIAYRNRLIEVGKIEEVGFEHGKFNPLATPEGFKRWGKHTATMDGYQSSVLMGVFDDVPACLNVFAEIKKQNGEVTKIKLYHDNETKMEYL